MRNSSSNQAEPISGPPATGDDRCAPTLPSAGSAKAKRRQFWVTVAKLSIGLVVIGCLWRSFASARDALAATPSFSFREISLPWLLAAAGCYLVAMVPMAIYWHVLNRAFGQQAPLWQTFRAYMIGHLGKYVPGKAMVVVLRTGFLRAENANRAVVATTVFIETFTMMAVGATVAALLIGWQFAEHRFLLGLACGLAVVSALPTAPPLLRFVVSKISKSQPSRAIQAGLDGYRATTVAVGWSLELVGWLFIGLSLWCVMRSFPNQPTSLLQHWPRLVASASLSMVAGFLSLLPGGLGVREVVLDQLLKQPFGPIISFTAPILLRMAWLLTELVVSGMLMIGVNRSRS